MSILQELQSSLLDGIRQSLDYEFKTEHIAVFATLILLEGILSFDNAAVLAAMVRRLPKNQQRKALLYGLVGAYAFRVAAIFLASILIASEPLKILGGSYLIYLAIDHFVRHTTKSDRSVRSIFGFGAFWSTVIMVELADLVFALDQIVAAVALTQEIPVIIAAACVAILALRLSATYMIRVMDWFPQLEHLAYVAVAWVGLKLLLEELFHFPHIPKSISVAVTLTILLVPILVKLVMEFLKRRRAPHGSDPGSATTGPESKAASATPETGPEQTH